MKFASSPRVNWGRIVAVQCTAALVAMLTWLVATGGGAQIVVWMLMYGFLPVELGGALPPVLCAMFFWWFVIWKGRGRIRELLAVMAGAAVGCVVPWFGLYSLHIPEDTSRVFVVLVGSCSAVGFAIWVLVAWRHGVGGASPDAIEATQPSLN